MRKRSEQASKEGLHCLNDQMKMAFELKAVGIKEDLEQLAQMHIDVPGSVWREVGPASRTHASDTA